MLKKDLSTAWSKATLDLYRKHWNDFTSFAAKLCRNPLPASRDLVTLYVTHVRHKNALKASTIQSRLSAIAHFHHMAELDSPTSGYIIDSLLKAYGKQDKPPATRKSITKDILVDLIQSVSHNETGYTRKLYRAMLCVMYHGLLRCSEVTHNSKCNHNIKASQITLEHDSHVKISFISYKHNKPDPAPLLIKSPGDVSCPYKAVKRYMKVRPTTSTFMFCNQNGRPVSRNQLVNIIKSHLAGCGRNNLLFNTHSLRMGKATDMHNEGYTDLQIAKAGRWSSNAFLKYIKPNIIIV